jgi:hypothetical protein
VRSSFAKIDKCRAPIRQANEHESTAADIACKGMGHRKSESDGDRRINGVSTRFQDGDTNIRSKGFLGDNHSFAGEHGFMSVCRGRHQAEAHN